MPNDTIPEWARELAEEVVGLIRATQDDFDKDTWFASMEERITNRLLRAEARGIERAAKVADRRAAMASQVSHPAAIALLQALPDAIRKLMESSDEA